MRVLITIGLSILMAVAIVIIAFGQNNSQTTETKENMLNRQLILPELRDTETEIVFQSALQLAKLPGGMVVSNCASPVKRNFVVLEKPTLGNVLKSIETADPNYRWELIDGVFNLIPRDYTSELLDLPIKEFKAKNVTDYEALNLLREKTEVKEKIVELGLNAAISSIHISSTYIPENDRENIPKFNLSYQDTTFRQILNGIVKKQGQLIWVFVEKQCGNRRQFSIYFVG